MKRGEGGIQVGDGTFGIMREQAIANSKVREVFTPFTPIDLVEHFMGRENEVSRIVGVINSPGQHALLYGDRGVGKTSLATIACILISKSVSKGKLFTKRCDSDDTFASVMRDPLKYVGVDCDIREENDSYTEGGNAKLKIPVAEGGLKSDRTKSARRVPYEGKLDSPSWVAERLSKTRALFLIDEVDALTRKTDRKKIAELIKCLSDAKSPFKLLVVGIASVGEDLTAGHPSVERCLKETHLSRMSDPDIRKIVTAGMDRLKLSPTDTVVDSIVKISNGYPYFTHLIALKCAENAVIDRRALIAVEHLNAALADAVCDAEGAFKRRYDHTLRGAKHAAEYSLIMRAASELPDDDFTLASLESALESIIKIDIPRRTLTRYVSNMIVNGGTGVFHRVKKGVYRFCDPRLPSFVKMVELNPATSR